MKIFIVIARVLMGLMFVVFGLNGFLHFLPQPPLPAGLASQYLGALVGSHYFVAVALIQVVGGALLLTNQFVPLALTLLGPVIVNILLFHVTMNPKGIGPGLLVTVCWLVVAYSVRQAFAGLFQQRVAPPPAA